MRWGVAFNDLYKDRVVLNNRNLTFKFMEELQQSIAAHAWLLPVLIILILWDIVWKLTAMWKAARNNQLAWYILIIMLNTVGILPIIYLLINKKRNSF
jgi:hypothetical protein